MMTRRGPAKLVEKGYGEARLKLARAFLKAAQDEMTLAEPADIGNPIVSQIVNAAIAYADALTGQFGGRVNQHDHSASTKNLAAALGNRFPAAQENRLRRILAEKDAAQYGIRMKSVGDARRLLGQLETFAAWVETEFARPH